MIFILADDLGYGDIGSYGQDKIATPRLDQLAGAGTVFTEAYAGAPVCAPSRCVLITGKHAGRARVRGNAGQNARQPEALALQPGDPSWPRLFQQAGYATGAVGKWGLGNVGAEETGLPTRQGFDYFFGYLNQAHAHNSFPSFLWRNEERVDLPNVVPNQGPLGTGVSSNQAVFAEDLFIDEALKFVRANQRRPFLLYFSPTLPHANNESAPIGLEVPSLGDYASRDWPETAKRFAAMVTRLDTDVGRLLDLLDELGLVEDTIVVFTSDNGPHREGGNDPEFFRSSGPLRGIKRDLYEGGIRVPMIVRWPRAAGKVARRDATPWGFADFLPTFADLLGDKKTSGDGVSVLSLWSGRARPDLAERPLYWEFYERGFRQAGRLGRWKAVRTMGQGTELYDLERDPRETSNVAAAHPQMVEQFEELFAREHTPSAFWLKSMPR